jgi:hypothetical protein
MRSINAHNRIKTIAIIAGVTFCCWLLTIPVHAQVGVGCQCVSDPPVEAATATIATSVTTAGGAGLFQGQAPFLDAMMQTLANGIPDAGTYAAYFQGWVDFGPNAAGIAASIAHAIVQTDLNSLTVYQSLAADFDAEDTAMQAIEACNQAAGQAGSVLMALQCNVEANLNVSQHDQLLEVAQLVRGINEAVHRGADFNSDAQSGANMQAWLTQASQD